MSNSMVLDRPAQGEDWIELDDETRTSHSPSALGDLIELEPPVGFPSQYAARFGPRAYTPAQAEVIQLAVRTRRPLRVPLLPLDD